VSDPQPFALIILLTAAVGLVAVHTFTSNMVGPHFEEICRQWARWYAGPQTYGTDPVRVASGTVPDADAQKTAEVDVAVFGRRDDNRDTLLAIGEAKWQENMTTSHLNRLEHIRDLLRAGGYAPTIVATPRPVSCGQGHPMELRNVTTFRASGYCSGRPPTAKGVTFRHLKNLRLVPAPSAAPAVLRRAARPDQAGRGQQGPGRDYRQPWRGIRGRAWCGPAEPGGGGALRHDPAARRGPQRHQPARGDGPVPAAGTRAAREGVPARPPVSHRTITAAPARARTKVAKRQRPRVCHGREPPARRRFRPAARRPRNTASLTVLTSTRPHDGSACLAGLLTCPAGLARALSRT